MGRVCSTYGEKMSAFRLLVGEREGKNHYEDINIYGSTILKEFQKNILELYGLD
jgi:hypothetical protein